MKKPIYAPILVLFLIFSCQGFEESITIKRALAFKGLANGEEWTSNDVSVDFLGTSIFYRSPSSQEGTPYQRVGILAILNSGQEIEIQLDLVNEKQLVGIYTTSYEDGRGLAKIDWTASPESGNLFPFYQLCTGQAGAAFTIERQNEEERLISGTFTAVLCERANKTDSIHITEGFFRDVPY